jgi:hypothetical protein
MPESLIKTNHLIFKIMKKSYFYFPQAKEWMWNYCIPLGKFTHKGKRYDLGVHVSEDKEISGAIVYGDNPGEYYSPDINSLRYPNKKFSMSPIYKETFKRLQRLIGRVPYVRSDFVNNSTGSLEFEVLKSKLDALGIPYQSKYGNLDGIYNTVVYEIPIGIIPVSARVILQGTGRYSIEYLFKDFLGSKGQLYVKY